MSRTNVKLAFKEDIRRTSLTLPGDAAENDAFDELLELIGRLFPKVQPSQLMIRYRDEDGDLIRIVSAEELLEAFSVAKSMQKTLKLLISESPKEAKAPTEEAKAPAQPSKEVPSQDEPAAAKPEADDAKTRGGPWSRGRHWRQEARRRRQEARQALKSEITAFFSDQKALTALGAAVPVVIDRVFKKEAVTDALDAVLADHPVLAGHSLVKRVVPIFKAITAFIPAGIVGPIVLEAMLELQSILSDSDGAEGPPQCRVKPFKILKRMFHAIKRAAKRNAPEVHFGITCDGSGMCPIIGPRWKKRGQDYDLCQTEYEKLSEQEKKAFHRVDPHGWRPPPFAQFFGGGAGFGPAARMFQAFLPGFCPGGGRGRGRRHHRGRSPQGGWDRC